MAKYCLSKELASTFKKMLKTGEINPVKLAEMTSAKRRDFFKFLGDDNAKNVNALFERKLLMKNKWQGMINWAKEVTGIKEPVRRDLLTKIQKMAHDEKLNLLDPKAEEQFLEDLVSSKLGFDIKEGEAKKIMEISQEIDKTKAVMEKNPLDKQKRIDYGNKIIDMYEYSASLKPKDSITENIIDVANVPRALMASMDFSAPFRQGFGMISRPEYWKNLEGMFEVAGSKTAYKNMKAEIITRPTYDLMKKSGLRLTGLGDKLSEMEEAFMTTLATKIPGVAASERAYVGFLTKLRADSFDDLIAKARLAGEDVKPGSKVAKDIADVVNTFTGAGSIKVGKFNMDQATPALNTLFFSPRKIAATIQKFNPIRYLDPRISPTARKAALRNLMGQVGASFAVAGLATMAGLDVEFDPRSSDFMKLKFRNTRFDLTGGDGNYTVLLARIMTNQTKTLQGSVKTLGEGYKADTRGDVIFRWFRNKLSPNASLIADSLYGKNAIGEEFDLFNLEKLGTENPIIGRLIPLTIQDAIGTAYEDPYMTFPSVLANTFGIGTSTYETSEAEKQSEEFDKLPDSKKQAFIDKLTDEEYKEFEKIRKRKIENEKEKTMTEEEKKVKEIKTFSVAERAPAYDEYFKSLKKAGKQDEIGKIIDNMTNAEYEAFVEYKKQS
jgi:hypothetical protein